MKIFAAIALASLVVLMACESTDDILDKTDHTAPAIVFTPDTLEVGAGSVFMVQASIEDQSGLQRIEFSYGDWRINKIIDLTEESGNESYQFTAEFTVPTNAKLEWEENLYFNDASSIKIKQHYHRLTLSAWDKNRNLAKGIIYVRVTE
ncbi:MAG: hypothetical protein R6V49_10600 [Bacteroidales bacterium]